MASSLVVDVNRQPQRCTTPTAADGGSSSRTFTRVYFVDAWINIRLFTAVFNGKKNQKQKTSTRRRVDNVKSAYSKSERM